MTFAQTMSASRSNLLNQRRIGFALSAVVGAYILSYLALSLQGRYEPSAIGLNGVKWYRWAPRGFVTDFRWNSSMGAAFLPLHFLDTKLWHTSGRAHSERYPVNEVSASEIARVYRAWMQ